MKISKITGITAPPPLKARYDNVWRNIREAERNGARQVDVILDDKYDGGLIKALQRRYENVIVERSDSVKVTIGFS